MRIAVLFDNFGPYHIARLAAASREFELLGVEVARRSAEYSWTPTYGTNGFRRETLVEQDTSDRADRRAIAGRLETVLSSFSPTVLAIPGWSSRAALLALRWRIKNGVPAALMSERQLID